MAVAQPSLNPVDQMITAVKNEHGQEEAFAVMRDGNNPEVFYVVPGRPRLEVRKTNGKDLPVFHLLKYQHKDKSGKIVNGGVLQFSVTFGIPEKVRKNLAAKIKSTYGVNKLRFAPFPIKTSNIKFYSLEGKPLETEEAEEEASEDESEEGVDSGSGPSKGVGPGFGNQCIPFQVKLNKLNANLYDNLVQGNGGLPILMQISYEGLTPKLGAKIIVNWDQTYRSFSANYKAGTQAQAKIVKMAQGVDYGFATDVLMKNDSLKIEATTGEGFNDEDYKAIMDLIVPKIMEEMFDTDKGALGFPAEIPEATAKELAMSEGGEGDDSNAIAGMIGDIASGASALTKLAAGLAGASIEQNVSLSIKYKERVKKGTQTFELSKRKIVTRRCAFGSCLNIKPWIKDKDQLITVMQPGQWAAAFFSLPAVGEPSYLGIEGINITVTPTFDGKPINTVPQQLAIFKKADDVWGWHDSKGKQINRMAFPIMAVLDKYKSKKDKTKLAFKTVTNIKVKRQKSIKVVGSVPMLNGDIPMSSPDNIVDTIILDGSCLAFAQKRKKGLVAVGGIIKTQKPNYSAKIKLTEKNPEAVILVPAKTKKLLAELKFVRNDRKKAPKDPNANKDFRSYCSDLNLYLFNEMWLNKDEDIADFSDDATEFEDETSDDSEDEEYY
jgi:hypothetical protein